MLKKVEDLMKKKDVLPDFVLTGQIERIMAGGEVDNMIVKSAEIIFKMPGLTAEQKTDFTQKLVKNPFIIADGEIIQTWEGDLVTIKLQELELNTTFTLKLANRNGRLHGEQKREYSNGRVTINTWIDGKIQTTVRYTFGLTTFIKYDKHENEIEKTFGQFDHLPKADNPSVETPFMKFYRILVKKCRDPGNIRAKEVCVHDIPDHKQFADWTKKFAKSNGYRISDNGEHLNW